MKTPSLLAVATLIFTTVLTTSLMHAASPEPSLRELRERAAKLNSQANYAEALVIYQQLLQRPDHHGQDLAIDLNTAKDCLTNLNRWHEVDALIDNTVKRHADDWWVLKMAGQITWFEQHYGHVQNNTFHRGNAESSGPQIYSFMQDRAKSLQFMQRAMRLMQKTPNVLPDYQRGFFISFAGYVLDSVDATTLLTLTDLEKQPDYLTNDSSPLPWGYRVQTTATPVGADGLPIYHQLPGSWEAAKTDGERWRWLLAQAAKINDSAASEVRLIFAKFMQSQIGEQTIVQWHQRGGGSQKELAEAINALKLLKDDETYAKLATGMKRLTMPDEFNYIRVLTQVADTKKEPNHAAQALALLAQTFENRRQLDRAADHWQRIVDIGPKALGEYTVKQAKDRREQLLGNWGRFDGTDSQLAGRKPVLGFVFRNAKEATFTARRVDVSKLLADIKTYLSKEPHDPDWQRTSVDNLGYQLLKKPGSKYIGKEVANWKVALEPATGHEEKREEVSAPLEGAGAYWIEAHTKGGNRSYILLWVADTKLVRKPTSEGVMYFTADAETGAPIAGATVELLGFRTEYKNNTGSQRPYQETHTETFTGTTDERGMFMHKPHSPSTSNQWLGLATTKEGRMAFIGFRHVWWQDWRDEVYHANNGNYFITDRPVYRPAQEVKFKVWLANATYNNDTPNPNKGKNLWLIIKDPRGIKIYDEKHTLDEYGGSDGAVTLTKEATLGVYQVSLSWNDPKTKNRGENPIGSLRVEEYKKPEFEVIVDAPKEPIALGGKITATVKANYYFGAPVANAKVKYKVQRSSHVTRWFPAGRWDWLYGRGYWWFAADAPWYPGWHYWGCKGPVWSWWPRSWEQPELVMEKEESIGADGTLKVEIDTADAKAQHGDLDHEYSITAEVTDESRRTITGSGSVIAAREPFKVFVAMDRGFYEMGEPMAATLHTLTPDGKAIVGKGKVRLFSIKYDKNGKPEEREVFSADVETNAEGHATQKLSASEPGQYRIACTITDAQGRSGEGGQLLVIRGKGFDGRQFRFNALELITEKKEYGVGEEVRLLINTERAGGYVVLFERAAGNSVTKPRIIHLEGKSTLVTLPVTQADMPNRFIEAFTVSGDRVHQITREIAVPPQLRILNLSVETVAKAKPREKATVKIKLTDEAGKPFTGSAVLTMYDKALDYISSGSNVPDIKQFFWGWKRQYYPQQIEEWRALCGNLTKEGETSMMPVGLYSLGGTYFGDQGTLDLSGSVRVLTKSGSGTLVLNGGNTVSADSIDGLLSRGGGFGAGSSRAFAMAGVISEPQFTTVSGGLLAAPSAPAAKAMKPRYKLGADKDVGDLESAPEGPAPMIRTQFADTALWVASITTKDDGTAEVSLDLPDNLTTWKLRSWAMGNGARVGEGSAELITSKDLIVRLQAPRFFVERDEVVLSANVHNYLDKAQQVRVQLELEGDHLALMEGVKPEAVATVKPNEETRIDWRAKVQHEGTVKVRVKALAQGDSDAMELALPVHVHGMLRTDSWSLALRGDQSTGKIEFTVPEQRRPEQTVLEVRATPSLASAMVDALPYLADYPYGCTEQTLNRFLPSVITRGVLNDMGLKLSDLAKRAPDASRRYEKNPLFKESKLDDMVRIGTERLANMQNRDGGWGWFSGEREQSYVHTTAVVVRGLMIAQKNGVALPHDTLSRAVEWLRKEQKKELAKLKNTRSKTDPWKEYVDNEDALVFSVLADADEWNKDMAAYLYDQREHVSTQSKALLGLAFDHFGKKEQRDMLRRNVEQFLVQDAENQTARLRLPDGSYWWRWHGNDLETNATYLRLLCKVDPKGATASGLAKFLVNNRRHGTYWNSTRDTAFCIEALADYMRASGETAKSLDVRYELVLDGVKKHEAKFTRDTLFSGDNRFVLQGEALTGGKHTLELRRRGEAPLYASAWLTAFTMEEHIPAAGLEVKVERHYWKLTPKEKKVNVANARGNPLQQRVEAYDRQEIKDGNTVKSGDLIEAELIVESKNDYEYLLVEDMKPAGFEATEVRSGYVGDALGSYLELRDERAAFFLRELPLGKHSLSYRLRAEVPGIFHALPAKVAAMYSPELKGNSDEVRVKVDDK